MIATKGHALVLRMSIARSHLRRLGVLIAGLWHDRRGAVAVQVAFLAIPLAILIFGLVDIGRLSLQRRQMQDALDAATLLAARSTVTTTADLEAVGDPAFLSEVAGLNLGLTASNVTFTMGANPPPPSSTPPPVQWEVPIIQAFKGSFGLDEIKHGPGPYA